jgi:hypothetical protein
MAKQPKSMPQPDQAPRIPEAGQFDEGAMLHELPNILSAATQQGLFDPHMETDVVGKAQEALRASAQPGFSEHEVYAITDALANLARAEPQGSPNRRKLAMINEMLLTRLAHEQKRKPASSGGVPVHAERPEPRRFPENDTIDSLHRHWGVLQQHYGGAYLLELRHVLEERQRRKLLDGGRTGHHFSHTKNMPPFDAQQKVILEQLAQLEAAELAQRQQDAAVVSGDAAVRSAAMPGPRVTEAGRHNRLTDPAAQQRALTALPLVQRAMQAVGSHNPMAAHSRIARRHANT